MILLSRQIKTMEDNRIDNDEAKTLVAMTFDFFVSKITSDAA